MELIECDRCRQKECKKCADENRHWIFLTAVIGDGGVGYTLCPNCLGEFETWVQNGNKVLNRTRWS